MMSWGPRSGRRRRASERVHGRGGLGLLSYHALPGTGQGGIPFASRHFSLAVLSAPAFLALASSKRRVSVVAEAWAARTEVFERLRIPASGSCTYPHQIFSGG